MRLSIVADDACICVDGACYRGCDMPLLDPEIHAVQWYGTYGEIEYKVVAGDETAARRANLRITSIDNFQWAVTVFNDVKAQNDALLLAAIAASVQPTAYGTQSL
jgi:hypothetical protein